MINKPVIGVAAAVVVIAAGTWYYLSRHGAMQHVNPVAPLTAAEPPPSESAIEHPLPAGQDSAAQAPLPTLAESDAPLRDALGRIAGASTWKDYVLPENIIRRLVVTIDNLPRQKVAVEKRPVAPVAGFFLADGDELHATLDPQNFSRYQPLVAAVGNMDVQQLTAVYIRFYPLFQQTYQNLGYPNGYFNDRLVQVIDTLLATPETTGPIALTRPNVMYTFADPALEARPAGQKLLIRMGPDNAATIKAKLKELRAAVTAAPMKR
jgi:hypothetical protein